MYNPSILRFDDFYFNGHWLSEFDGIIAGKNDGIPSFSILPSKEIKTDKGVLGMQGERVYGMVYNPRIIPVNVVFKDLSRIREIASWLDVSSPTDFYFKDDTLKIKVIYDNAIDVEYGYIETKLGGEITLNFMAHYPFFSAINDIKYIINKNTVNNSSTSNYVTTIDSTTMNNITITNSGNRISYPLFKITGTGSITVNLNGTSFTVNNLTDYVYVDTKYMTVYKPVEINKILDFTGDFPTLNVGNNTITITGTCTSIEVQTRAEWN